MSPRTDPLWLTSLAVGLLFAVLLTTWWQPSDQGHVRVHALEKEVATLHGEVADLTRRLSALEQRPALAERSTPPRPAPVKRAQRQTTPDAEGIPTKPHAEAKGERDEQTIGQPSDKLTGPSVAEVDRIHRQLNKMVASGELQEDAAREIEDVLLDELDSTWSIKADAVDGYVTTDEGFQEYKALTAASNEQLEEWLSPQDIELLRKRLTAPLDKN